MKDSGAQEPARGRKEQNWPALTSKSGSEERITGDLVTGVGDKVKGKAWTL